MFSTFCSLITIAQSRDLKSAHEDFVNRKTDASLTKLKKYFAEAKKVEIEDAILYYWLFSNNLAVPGTNQDLEFAYELIQDCMQYSVKLNTSDEKGFLKLAEKFDLSLEKQGMLMASLDDELARNCLAKRNLSELTTFIEKHPASAHLFECSDLIDELKVKQAISSHDPRALEYYTKIENYNTEPVDKARKGMVYNRLISQVNKEFEAVLVEKAIDSKKASDVAILQSKFPNCIELPKLKTSITQEHIASIENKLKTNNFEAVGFRKNQEVNEVENGEVDYPTESKTFAAFSNDKLFYVSQHSISANESVEKKYYFNEEQKLIFIEFVPKNFNFEVSPTREKISEEIATCYFYNNEIIENNGTLITALEINRASELSRLAFECRNLGEGENGYSIVKTANPYAWKSKVTHTLVYRQNGYNVSLEIANSSEDTGMAIEGDAILTLKKGDFVQKLALHVMLLIGNESFQNGVYRMPDSEVEEFPFLKFIDYNFDSKEDLVINEMIGMEMSANTFYACGAGGFFNLDPQFSVNFNGGDLEIDDLKSELTMREYLDGTYAVTYKLESGVWRFVHSIATYVDFDEGDNMYEITSEQILKAGKIIKSKKRVKN